MQYVIIGGGPAATNAMETIRLYDQDGSIVLISDEPAHSRMALPYWLNGKILRAQTLTANPDSYAQLGVDARIGTRAKQLDLDGRHVVLDDGESIPFDRLFLATGSSPVVPPIEGADLPGVQTMWTLADIELALNTTAGIPKPRIVFVGAGFVGMILVGALSSRDCQLTVVEQADQILPRMLDPGAASIAERWLGERDVQVHTGTQVVKITADAAAKQVILSNGETIVADLVVLATGVQPNLQLVRDTPIATDHGILVDQHLQTNIEGVYAGGDVAQGPARYEDQPVIHAIQPTAVDHGRVAGANMAGATVEYPGSLSMNVVDVCGLQCISYGSWRADDDDDVVVCNDKDFVYRRFIFRGDHLVGALFAGWAPEVGMLNDVGMVKGILQVQPPLGSWKAFIKENPFDVRRPYVGLGVAKQLAESTLLGRPAQARQYRYEQSEPESTNTPAHRILIDAAKQA